jgi:hypothetical protein
MIIVLNKFTAADRTFILALSFGLINGVVSKVDYIPLKGITFDDCLINLN